MRTFKDTWPPFLDKLDLDPKEAALEFCEEAYRILTITPPRVLAAIPIDQRADVVNEVLLHFIDDGCRVLRLYHDRGIPFAAWFYLVSRNVILRHVRELGRLRQKIAGASGDRPESAAVHNNPGNQRSESDQRHLAHKVNDCIGRLDRRCQILLRLASEEYLPREIARLVGASCDNKKISDDLRYCRKKLLDELHRQGVDVGL